MAKNNVNSDKTKRKVYKIVLLGDEIKSMVLKHIGSETFIKDHIGTLGADFAVKEITSEQGTLLELQFWQVSSNPEFKHLWGRFIKAAKAVLLVFNGSKPESLGKLQFWVDEFITPAPIPMAVVGVTANQVDSSISPKDAQAFADSLTEIAFIRVPYIAVNLDGRDRADELISFLSKIEDYLLLLSNFTVEDRKEVLLAEKLYEKVKVNENAQPDLDDMIKYIQNFDIDTVDDWD